MPLFGSKSSSEFTPAPSEEGAGTPITREELVVHVAPNSPIAEQYRRMRNSLQSLNPDGAARSILVTSSIEGEGKTVSTLNLGLALAELPNLRILVIDGDFARSSVERYLDLPPRQGLSELLGGTITMDQAIRSTSVERFDVVGPGAPIAGQAEVLNVDRIRAVLNALKRRYDYILVDVPPVLTMNHPSVLGSIADGILLVVRLGKTPKPLVEEAFSMLENLGGNVLGTCVTGTGEVDG
jgi:capsular exopolysaccharide synthesis family protein